MKFHKIDKKTLPTMDYWAMGYTGPCKIRKA